MIVRSKGQFGFDCTLKRRFGLAQLERNRLPSSCAKPNRFLSVNCLAKNSSFAGVETALDACPPPILQAGKAPLPPPLFPSRRERLPSHATHPPLLSYGLFIYCPTHCLLLTTCYLPHTNWYLLLTTHYSLLTPHSSLPTTHYPLLTTHYSLLPTHYSLLTTHCSLLTTHCSLLTTHYSLLTTGTSSTDYRAIPRDLWVGFDPSHSNPEPSPHCSPR